MQKEKTKQSSVKGFRLDKNYIRHITLLAGHHSSYTLFFFGTELTPRSRKQTQKVGTLRYEAAKSFSSLIHQRPARQRANRWQIPQGVRWIISGVKQLLLLNSVHATIWGLCLCHTTPSPA